MAAPPACLGHINRGPVLVLQDENPPAGRVRVRGAGSAGAWMPRAVDPIREAVGILGAEIHECLPGFIANPD